MNTTPDISAWASRISAVPGFFRMATNFPCATSMAPGLLSSLRKTVSCISALTDRNPHKPSGSWMATFRFDTATVPFGASNPAYGVASHSANIGVFVSRPTDLTMRRRECSM